MGVAGTWYSSYYSIWYFLRSELIGRVFRKYFEVIASDGRAGIGGV